MLKRISHLIFITFLSTLLFACGGGGGGEEGNTGTTAPTVSSTSPASSATAVARNSSITATFDEDMFAATVDSASFTLVNPAAGNIPGSVNFDDVNNVATFSPDNPLAILATYTATLSSAITDLSGNALASDYSWSFTTEDGSWGEATLIETDAGTVLTVVYPQIAVNNKGNALAVWQQSDGIRDNIWANRFDGTNWGSATLIDAVDGNAVNPQIAVDNNGNALAVWQQSDGIRDNIWANRFDGSSWDGATLVEVVDQGRALNPQIALDNDSNAFVVWQQVSGDGGTDIWANRLDDLSRGWGGGTLIETVDGDALNPQIAVDNNGNALAVWQQYDGTQYSISANRFDGTNWGNATLIDAGAGNAANPQIAVDNNGNALAVWRQGDGAGITDIWVNRFDGTNWGSATLIDAGAGKAFTPQIAVDNNGNALVVWEQPISSHYIGTWANRFDGTSWDGATLVESGARKPQIAVDNNGNALAVWMRYDSGRYNIGVNRFE